MLIEKVRQVCRAVRRLRKSWRQFRCRQSDHQPVVWRWRIYRRSPAYYFFTGRAYGQRLQPYRENLVLIQEINFETRGHVIRCERCGAELMKITHRELVEQGGPVDWLGRFKRHWQKYTPPGWI